MKIDDAAIDVMREHAMEYIWYGHPDVLHDIAIRAGCKATHPINVLATVMSQLARSEKFEFAGHIEHMGRKYPVRRITRPNNGGELSR